MKKYILIGMSLLLLVGLLAGCSGVKQADLDAANTAKNAALSQVNTLQNQVSAANAQVSTLQNQLNTANAAQSQDDANKALVSRYYEIVNLPDLKGYEDLLAPDYKRYTSDNTPPISGDANKKRLLGFHAVFPDFQLTIEQIVAEGDLVAAHETFTGTQKAPFLGIPPTGKMVKLWDVEVFRIENGKIVEQWGGPDIFDGIQQMGAVVSAKADLDAAKAQLDADNAAKSQADANKALVQNYYKIVNTQDLNGYEDLLSADYMRHVSDNAAPLNGDANKKRMLGFHAVFPDFLLTPEEIVAEGDLVAAHCVFTGTQEAPFLGIPPTNIQIKVWSVEVFRIEDGKIVEMWGGPDVFNGLQQIGAVISAGQ
jgi:predicted ester cyclase